jgi:hypothetical protein
MECEYLLNNLPLVSLTDGALLRSLGSLALGSPVVRTDGTRAVDVLIVVLVEANIAFLARGSSSHNLLTRWTENCKKQSKK